MTTLKSHSWICFNSLILVCFLLPSNVVLSQKVVDASMSIISDVECFLRVDGKLRARLKPNDSRDIIVKRGVHDLLAVTLDGKDQLGITVKVQTVDVPVKINLKEKINLRLGNQNYLEKDNMVFVRGGVFNMGDKNGEPDERMHRVKVKDFYIAKHEVTKAEFKKFASMTSYRTMAEKEGYSMKFNGEFVDSMPVNFKNISEGDNVPVAAVSWYDAIKYCNWKSQKNKLNPVYKVLKNKVVVCDFNANGYRLPTEAEWEFAARGGNSSKLSKYSGSHSFNNVAWVQENAGMRVHEVGKKTSNELGLFDMSGNVLEWCWDIYNDQYYLVAPFNNPKGPDYNANLKDYARVIRGGAALYPHRYARVANRSKATEDWHSDMIGFRVVRQIIPNAASDRNFIQ